MSRPVPNRARPLIRYAQLSKLVSRLNVPVHWHVKKFRNELGPEGRLLKMRQTVTALFKYERIETTWARADEARGYAERLISEAVRNGPHCSETMELADWWLEEKQLVHKLFKVLVPRYQNFPTAYTSMYNAPYKRWSDGFTPELKEDDSMEINEVNPAYHKVSYAMSVLELKGHPYPPLLRTHHSNHLFIQNVLLSSAKKFLSKESALEANEDPEALEEGRETLLDDTVSEDVHLKK